MESGKMEIASTPLNKAKAYLVSKNIIVSAFEQHYQLAQKKITNARTQRRDMPVINGSDVRLFQQRLQQGYIDINKPFSKDTNPSNPFPEGLSGEKAEEFLSAGLSDGDQNDDKISVSKKTISVKDLKPIQKQIYVDFAIDSIERSGSLQSTIDKIKSRYFIVSTDNYIIDGHHRFLCALLIDPNIKVNCMVVNLPINKLLPMSLAYGDAIGNQRNM